MEINTSHSSGGLTRQNSLVWEDTQETADEIKEAKNEFKDLRPTLSVFNFNSDDIESAFNSGTGFEGKQITQFFHFLAYVIITNLIMTVWCFIGWIPHMRSVQSKFSLEGMDGKAGSYSSLTELIFLSSYQPSSDGVWTAMVVLGSLTMLGSGPLYYYMTHHAWVDSMTDGQKEGTKESIPVDDRTAHYKSGQDNTPQPFKTRRILSYTIFAFLCCVPAAYNFGLLYVANMRTLRGQYEAVAGDYPTGRQNILGFTGASMAVVVSILTSIANLIFEYIAGILSEIEQPASWSEQRVHRLAKLSIFRLFNVMSLFIIRYFADAPFYTCLASRIGSQIFIFILLDLTINYIIEWFLVVNNYLFEKLTGQQPGLKPTYQQQAPIELTDEYFKVIYRQYVMMFSFPVFPPICFLCLAANFVEYTSCKVRFINFSRKPEGQFRYGQKLVSYLLCGAAIAGLLHFPSGPIWYAPPVGPILCWPCQTFSQSVVMSTGGVCQPAFEEVGCRADNGSLIGQDTIQYQIYKMTTSANTSTKEYQEGKQWFENNPRLFNSPRCGCRPCNLILTCPCFAPPPQRLDTPAAAAASVTSPRSTFSYAAYQKSGLDKGQYCGSNPINKDCWQCPEAVTGSLVDPVRMMDAWPKVSFCQKCVSSDCICNRRCTFNLTDT